MYCLDPSTKSLPKHLNGFSHYANPEPSSVAGYLFSPNLFLKDDDDMFDDVFETVNHDMFVHFDTQYFGRYI